MKKFISMILWVVFLITGCVVSDLKIPQTSYTSHLKGYKRITLLSGKQSPNWKYTGVAVVEGDRVLVLTSLKDPSPAMKLVDYGSSIMMEIGGNFIHGFKENRTYLTAPNGGLIRLGAISIVQMNTALIMPEYVVDLFFVSKQNERFIAQILKDFSLANRNDPFLVKHISALPAWGPDEIKDKSDDILVKTWKSTALPPVRTDIIKELTIRRAKSSIIDCYQHYLETGDLFSDNEAAELLDAFSTLKLPETVPVLIKSGSVNEKKLAIRLLNTLRTIGVAECLPYVSAYLNGNDIDVRFAAMDVLGEIKDPASVKYIYRILYDNNPEIRWKAIQTIGKIGNPEAVDRISVLLADKNQTVKGLAEMTLQNLGVSKQQIAEWKKKAAVVSLDDIHKATVELERTKAEKAVLESRLENEADVKNQLQASLAQKEGALQKQKQLLASVYEKERHLDTMNLQLEKARQESDAYQQKIRQLNEKAEALNRTLSTSKSTAEQTLSKMELDNVLKEKQKFDEQNHRLKMRENAIKEEAASLNSEAIAMRNEAEKAKKDLEDLKGRESLLVSQVEDLKKRLNRGMAPVVVVSKPKDGDKTTAATLPLHFIAIDDKGLASVDILLNGRSVAADTGRGIQVLAAVDKADSKKRDYTQRLTLQMGKNIIRVKVTDSDGVETEESVTVFREKELGRIWAAVIGLNKYKKIRHLKYAVDDALAFQAYLKENIGLSDDQIFVLLDEDATRVNVSSLLGTRLKKLAGYDDTVIIYYAGHGGIETDPENPDGDGFEKYLLPYDANPEDLYSTGIAMKEVRTIFHRINANRLIFIADTCYSGASGGRTLLAGSTRATLSDKFFERLSRGKGRVILSASAANEISRESDDFKHGVFTHYLLEGLKGKADNDGDGLITIGELFGYVSKEVPNATGQDQHPVKKGETEGELVIGKVK